MSPRRLPESSSGEALDFKATRVHVLSGPVLRIAKSLDG